MVINKVKLSCVVSTEKTNRCVNEYPLESRIKGFELNMYKQEHSMYKQVVNPGTPAWFTLTLGKDRFGVGISYVQLVYFTRNLWDHDKLI